MTLEEAIKGATKAFRKFARVMSTSYAAGYYIQNHRGRHKLVPIRREYGKKRKAKR